MFFITSQPAACFCFSVFGGETREPSGGGGSLVHIWATKNSHLCGISLLPRRCSNTCWQKLQLRGFCSQVTSHLSDPGCVFRSSAAAEPVSPSLTLCFTEERDTNVMPSTLWDTSGVTTTLHTGTGGGAGKFRGGRGSTVLQWTQSTPFMFNILIPDRQIFGLNLVKWLQYWPNKWWFLPCTVPDRQQNR